MHQTHLPSYRYEGVAFLAMGGGGMVARAVNAHTKAPVVIKKVTEAWASAGHALRAYREIKLLRLVLSPVLLLRACCTQTLYACCRMPKHVPGIKAAVSSRHDTAAAIASVSDGCVVAVGLQVHEGVLAGGHQRAPRTGAAVQ